MKEAGGAGLQVEEDASDDHGENGVEEGLDESDARIGPEALPSSPEAQLDLLHIGECVRRLSSLRSGLLRRPGLDELLQVFAANRIRLVVIVEVSHELLVVLELVIDVRKSASVWRCGQSKPMSMKNFLAADVLPKKIWRPS